MAMETLVNAIFDQLDLTLTPSVNTNTPNLSGIDISPEIEELVTSRLSKFKHDLGLMIRGESGDSTSPVPRSGRQDEDGDKHTTKAEASVRKRRRRRGKKAKAEDGGDAFVLVDDHDQGIEPKLRKSILEDDAMMSVSEYDGEIDDPDFRDGSDIEYRYEEEDEEHFVPGYTDDEDEEDEDEGSNSYGEVKKKRKREEEKEKEAVKPDNPVERVDAAFWDMFGFGARSGSERLRNADVDVDTVAIKGMYDHKGPCNVDPENPQTNRDQDPVTLESLLTTDKHVFVLGGDGKSRICYNPETLKADAKAAGMWRQPPAFRGQMSIELKQQLRNVCGIDFFDVDLGDEVDPALPVVQRGLWAGMLNNYYGPVSQKDIYMCPICYHRVLVGEEETEVNDTWDPLRVIMNARIGIALKFIFKTKEDLKNHLIVSHETQFNSNFPPVRMKDLILRWLLEHGRTEVREIQEFYTENNLQNRLIYNALVEYIEYRHRHRRDGEGDEEDDEEEDDNPFAGKVTVERDGEDFASSAWLYSDTVFEEDEDFIVSDGHDTTDDEDEAQIMPSPSRVRVKTIDDSESDSDSDSRLKVRASAKVTKRHRSKAKARSVLRSMSGEVLGNSKSESESESDPGPEVDFDFDEPLSATVTTAQDGNVTRAASTGGMQQQHQRKRSLVMNDSDAEEPAEGGGRNKSKKVPRLRRLSGKAVFEDYEAIEADRPSQNLREVRRVGPVDSHQQEDLKIIAELKHLKKGAT